MIEASDRKSGALLPTLALYGNIVSPSPPFLSVALAFDLHELNE